jgi:tryptophan synthase alpha chain
MNRLGEILHSARGRRTAVIPYVCAGDPDVTTSAAVIAALRDGGAEIVEIGMPFSDPVGDGATIAAAAQRALQNGVTLSQTLDLCARFAGGPATLLFGYLNPIARYGVARFAADAARAGVCGVIVADLPYEEAALVRDHLKEHDIALILLVSPTTPPERAVHIAEASDAFVYVVSRLGVTGAGCEPDIEPLVKRLEMLKARTTRPLAVGFGLKNGEHVRLLGAHADAVVVGSALLDRLSGLTGSDAAAAASTFLQPLVAAAGAGPKEPSA